MGDTTAPLLSRDEIIAAMPASGRQLVDVIGLKATLDLMLRCGGKRFFIPRRLVKGAPCKLLQNVGPWVAAKLVRAMPGARFEAPMLSRVEVACRHAAIWQDFHASAADSSVHDRYARLVERYQMTRRGLRKIIATYTAAGKPFVEPQDGIKLPQPSVLSPCEVDPAADELSALPERLVLAAADREAIVAVMPATARELVDVIGFDATLDVLRKFGGKRLHVPEKLVDGVNYKLVEELGRATAVKLVDVMPYTYLEPPTMISIERLLRDNAIRADFDRMCADGEPRLMDRLVDRYQVTQRHLRKVLKASPSTFPRQQPQRRAGFARSLYAAVQSGAVA